MRRIELAPNSNDPVLEQREQAAAHVVKVLKDVRAELARAEALLLRLSRRHPADMSVPAVLTQRAPKVADKLAETLFERGADL